jgi:hypothetical protein
MNSQQHRTLRRMVEEEVANALGPRNATTIPPKDLQAKTTDKIKPDIGPPLRKTVTGRASRIAKRTAQIAGTVIGFFAAILGIVTGYLALLPRISVSQNDQLDPSNTFSSPFIISNDGPLPIENVRFACGIIDVKHENGPEMIGDQNFGSRFFVMHDKEGKIAGFNLGSPEMLPGERSTIPSCSYPWLNPVEYANIGIVVEFRIGYTPFPGRRVFRFGTLKDAAGKLHWFPFPIK